MDRPEQNVAGIDVGTDVHQALDHPSTDVKRQFGADARLDIAGQADHGLSRLKPDNLAFYRGRGSGRSPWGLAGRQDQRERYNEMSSEGSMHGRTTFLLAWKILIIKLLLTD